MVDDFDPAVYLRGFPDPEDRARTIWENGWSGLPELEAVERLAANPRGGTYQRLLAALRKREPAIPKRALRRMEHKRRAHSAAFGERRSELLGVTQPESELTATDATIFDLRDPPPQEQNQSDLMLTGALEAPASTLEVELGWWVYENQRKLWPHLKGEVIPKPPGWEAPPPLIAVNPFAPVRRPARSSDLTADAAVRLYNAIAFGMWRHGAIMNVHVVILWETLRVHEHERAAKILSEYLNQAKKGAAVGTPGAPRQRRRGRTGEGFEFRYVYVHENATQQGFHTHLLGTVPRPAADAFRAWSMKTLARLARHRGDGRTIRVVVSNAKDEDAAVARCWNWFRYMTKQLGRTVGWGRVDESPRPLREILKVWPYRTALPVTCARLVGGSQDLWSKAQKAAGFTSRLVGGDLDQIYAGGELNEWRSRLKAEELAKFLNRLEI
jgi:hypothetical protein